MTDRGNPSTFGDLSSKKLKAQSKHGNRTPMFVVLFCIKNVLFGLRHCDSVQLYKWSPSRSRHQVNSPRCLARAQNGTFRECGFDWEGIGKVGFEVSELPSTNDNAHQVGEFKTRRLVSMLKYAEPRPNTRDTGHGKEEHGMASVATRTMD